MPLLSIWMRGLTVPVRSTEAVVTSYTMVEERAMFDAVMRGMPVKDALEQYMTARMQEVEASGGDIELF